MKNFKKPKAKEIDKINSKVKHYLSPESQTKIREAWEFCIKAHAGQLRKTGEPFAYHPYVVCKILADWELDETTLIAGLLHDVLEDGGVSEQKVRNFFGPEVLAIVQGVTKVTGVHFSGTAQDRYAENIRKMVLVMAKDLRVVLVKLADRLHNMRTLYALSPRRQKENAIETLEIYAPLADRMQMGKVKAELEDLAFPYAFPAEYRDLVQLCKKPVLVATRSIKEIKRQLSREFEKEGLLAEIDIRRKHLYSLWRKLQRPEMNMDINKIHDLLAARVIVEAESDCYKALGIIHKAFKPVTSVGVSDYIARPKPNGYRSIHTKVYTRKGKIFEIQIRTKQMHEEAEEGLSAHWNYSHVKAHGANDETLEKGLVKANQSKFAWVKELANWQKEMRDSKEFLRAVKFDAFQERIYVYSPMGDAYDLPKGATPVDFAFAVHTDLGHHMKLAKVNGKIVPFDYILKSGEVVEIIKTKDPLRPNPDWVDFVMTARARSEINKANS